MPDKRLLNRVRSRPGGAAEWLFYLQEVRNAAPVLFVERAIVGAARRELPTAHDHEGETQQDILASQGVESGRTTTKLHSVLPVSDAVAHLLGLDGQRVRRRQLIPASTARQPHAFDNLTLCKLLGERGQIIDDASSHRQVARSSMST